jgi:quercetin dioxygenase-like cupin family protein
MSDKYIKNIEFSTVLPLADQVNYQPGQIVSKTLAQNKALSLTLFAFDKDEEISTHESDGDAMVIALDGKSKITIDGEDFILSTGETIIMPSRKPHAVYALEQFKMYPKTRRETPPETQSENPPG